MTLAGRGRRARRRRAACAPSSSTRAAWAPASSIACASSACRCVFGINFGSGAERWDADGAKPLYANKRAEMWGNVQGLAGARARCPPIPSCAPTSRGVEYGFNASGEIQLEKKEDMKKRGLASPDIGDALALTFAAPGDRRRLGPARRCSISTRPTYDLYREFDEDYWWGDDN